MKDTRQFGCFTLKNGIPDEYYAFTDGEISATVERNGGINTVSCLDIYEQDGKLYPDRGKTPAIFLREGNNCGKRPLYGPAVQFISTTRGSGNHPGRNLFHVPDQLTLYPFGFKSESSRFGGKTTYDLAIDGRQMLFSFTNNFSSRQDLVISINKDHIYQGPANSLKNQIDERYWDQEHPPFKEERNWEQKWDFIGFDPGKNGFVIEGVMRFTYGDKPVSILFAANKKINFSENNKRYFLTIP